MYAGKTDVETEIEDKRNWQERKSKGTRGKRQGDTQTEDACFFHDIARKAEQCRRANAFLATDAGAAGVRAAAADGRSHGVPGASSVR